MRNSFLVKFILMSFVVLLFFLVGTGGLMRQPRFFHGFIGLVRQRDIWIVDGRGRIITANTSAPLPLVWTESILPRENNGLYLVPGSRIESLVGIERLDGGGEPVFEVFRRKGRPGGAALSLSLIILIPLVTGYVLFTGLFLLSYMRRNARIAERVLIDLKNGNLKSRFPIGQMDEAGRLMHQFNEMAAEIESLLERLKHAESVRTQLLRELAHDLRTPLTAISFQMETVADLAGQLSPEQTRSKMEVAIGEMQYFKRLLEDLFLLAQLDEPGYRQNLEPVDLLSLANAEAERAEEVLAGEGKSLRIEVLGPSSGEGTYRGDPHLLRRLFQNAIQNAARYAVSAVHVRVEPGAAGAWSISVDDDGCGFSEEALGAFGKRRSGRFLQASGTKSVSLGLGSVILCRIATLCGGGAEPSNRRNERGNVIGARLSIRLSDAAATAAIPKAA